jgi:uncharacterized Fe-S cluster-containing radical SAM superfamily enzyme
MATMKRKLTGTCPVCGKAAFGVVRGHAVHGWMKIGGSVVPNPTMICALSNGQTLRDRHMEMIDLDAPAVVKRTMIVHSLDAGKRVKHQTVEKLSKSAGKPGLLKRLAEAIKG